MKTQTIRIDGFVPSKKNQWRHGKFGVYIPREVKDELNLIENQIRRQWRIGPIRHPGTVYRFVLSAPEVKSDRDNKYQTLQDCLVRAGVLVDDCIKHNNGWITEAPAILHSDDKDRDVALIQLRWHEENEVVSKEATIKRAA